MSPKSRCLPNENTLTRSQREYKHLGQLWPISTLAFAGLFTLQVTMTRMDPIHLSTSKLGRKSRKTGKGRTGRVEKWERVKTENESSAFEFGINLR